MNELKPNRLTLLQLYFPSASRARMTRLWHQFSAPALAQHLLSVATAAKIEQVILRTVTTGYLPGQRLSHYHPERGGMRHPQCLELLDTEDRLRAFLSEHSEGLRKVRAALMAGRRVACLNASAVPPGAEVLTPVLPRLLI